MEKLSGKKINKLLEGAINLTFLKSTPSTLEVENLGAVVAARQKKGRGRGDKQFYSPKGGIYITLKASITSLMTIKAAVGVMRVLEQYGLSPKVKWVNDIMLEGKKVCGILTIQHPKDSKCALVGIGINYSTKRFPQGLNAASLFETSAGINKFTAQIITSVFDALSEDCLQYYKEHLQGIGQEIMINGLGEARFEGITDEGHLMYSQGEIRGKISYGEIELLKQH